MNRRTRMAAAVAALPIGLVGLNACDGYTHGVVRNPARPGWYKVSVRNTRVPGATTKYATHDVQYGTYADCTQSLITVEGTQYFSWFEDGVVNAGEPFRKQECHNRLSPIPVVERW